MAMRKISALGLAMTVCALLLAIACGGSDDSSDTPTPAVSVALITQTGSTTPRNRRTLTPSPTPSATPLQVCAPNPDPADPKLLQTEEPLPNSQVGVPIFVRGWGSDIIRDNKGVVLAVVDQKQSVVQVNNLPAQPRDYRVPPPGLEVTDFTAPFAADIIINNVNEPTPYCLWIYLNTDDAGHAKQVLQIPVIVLPRQ
ncbi:MAG: hypothetical protein ABI559_00730 [Chloroflexota bacterium]